MSVNGEHIYIHQHYTPDEWSRRCSIITYGQTWCIKTLGLHSTKQ